MLNDTLVSYHFLSGIFVKRNKVVVGSRNEGVSNYAGEDVTGGIQFYFSVIMRPKTRYLG